MAVKLRCPACRGTFPWDVSQGFPDTCLLCEEYIGCDRADDDIVMPSIRSARMAVSDQVYRDMEKKSEIRAQAAADHLGVPVAEVSDLKITDLRSTRHPGDVAAPPLPAHLRNVGNFGMGAIPQEAVAALNNGPAAYAGARARTALQAHHQSLTNGFAVTDSPALETQQPGYRRRG